MDQIHCDTSCGYISMSKILTELFTERKINRYICDREQIYQEFGVAVCVPDTGIVPLVLAVIKGSYSYILIFNLVRSSKALF